MVEKRKIKSLYKDIVEGDVNKVPKATAALSRLDHPLSLLAAISLLSHEYPEVRLWAKEQVELRQKYLYSPDTDNQFKNEIYKRLGALLLSKKPYVREIAVETLGKLRDDDNKIASAISVLLRSENDRAVIAKAIEALGQCNNEIAYRTLKWMLKSERFVTFRKEIEDALSASDGLAGI